MDILVISPREGLWQQLAPQFEARGADLRTAGTLDDGLKALNERHAALVVLDLGTDRATVRQAVFRVLSVDAMIHTAAVTDMSAEEFHDAMEGLGMLTSLPMQPSTADVDRLMDALQAMNI